jgi:hypothetical protein
MSEIRFIQVRPRQDQPARKPVRIPVLVIKLPHRPKVEVIPVRVMPSGTAQQPLI